MMYAEGKEILKFINLDRFPIPIQLECSPGYSEFRLITSLQVKSIETNEMIWIRSSVSVDISNFDQRDFLKFVQKQVHFMVVHELDECFMVEGMRIFDPHKRG